jgi:hypothetical protein
MRSAFRVMALCGLVLDMGFSQTTQPTTSQLEALEHFAKQPTAQVTWSKEVGRIDTAQAHAIITALIVDDATQTPRQMHGISIDLIEGELRDRIYASEDLLDRLIRALDGITDAWPRWLSQVQTRGCLGSGEFWQQQGHTLAVAQCAGTDWEGFSGLSIGTGTTNFRLPGVNPALLAGAIARGRDELKRH